MANVTAGRGACNAPFLQQSEFPNQIGYMSGRFCAPVPTTEGSIDCCLPCPVTDWVYSDDFDVIPKAANWLTVAGMVCSMSLLISYLVLPAKQTSRHYLTVGLVVAICVMQLGFIVPMAARPQECHDAITPNDMYSDFTCAFSGASLLFGGFAGFLRSVSIHLQICWQVVPGTKFFWASLLAGWGFPALIISITLPVTGISYRFGATCHINHNKALYDYWGPLLTFAAISTILQFATFGYCIRVYIRSLFDDGTTTSMSQSSSGGLPSYNTRSGSIRTLTARQAYRRIKKVIALQWRGTAIVLIIIVNVVYLAVVFVQMDNTMTAALQDLERVQPWLLCLILNQGNKNACLDKVKEAHLVTSEPKAMSVLLLLSLNGIWAFIFLGRTSMLSGWRDLMKRPFARRKTDFVSVDARRFSADPKQYEMIMSPPSRSYSMPDEPERAITSPLAKEDGLSPLPQSPPTHYDDDLVDRETHLRHGINPYPRPQLSFSTPRPPSLGRTYSRDTVDGRSSSKGDQAAGRSFSPSRLTIGRPFTPSTTASRTGAYSPSIDWDPTSTHAKPWR
ncbi:MAG: hypothetical protein Q9163_001525 [Psora crenata]